MPSFEVKLPDGRTFDVQAPDMETASKSLSDFVSANNSPELSPHYQQFPYGATSELQHAATFGLARPLTSAIAAIGPTLKGQGFGQAYTQAEKEYDAAREQYQKANPGTSLATAILGSLGGIGTGGQAAATALGRMGQGAKLGGTIGGTMGLSESSGTPTERLAQGAAGGITGAALGGALPAVFDAGRFATTGVKNLIGGVRNPEQAAVSQVAQALARDKINPQAIQQALADAEAAGVRESTLADVAGKNAQQLAAVYGKTPGAGKEAAQSFLEQRTLGRAANTVDIARPGLGHPELTYDAIDRKIAERAAAAAPAYQRAYSEGDKIVWSPKLEQLSAAPDVQEAMHGAVRAWQTNAIADGYGAMNPGAMEEAGGQLKFLHGKVPVFPNIQFWDYTKRILDDKIATAIKAGENQKAGALTKIVKQLRVDLDQQVPSFAAARAAYAGPSQSKKAIEFGQTALDLPPEEIRRAMATFEPADREFVRLGAVRQLKEKAGSSSDRTRELLSPNMRERFAEIFPDKNSYDQAYKGWELIKKQSDLANRIRGGSSTFENLATSEGLQPSAVLKAAQGRFIGAAADAVGGALNRLKGITPAVAEKGIRLLLSPDPAVQRATLEALQRYGVVAPRGTNLQRGLLGGLAGLVQGSGGLLGNLQTQ